jgi:hypothetical protein
VPPKKSIKIGRGAPAAQGGVEAADVVEALAVEVQCTVERYGIENKFGYRVRGQGSRKNVRPFIVIKGYSSDRYSSGCISEYERRIARASKPVGIDHHFLQLHAVGCSFAITKRCLCAVRSLRYFNAALTSTLSMALQAASIK